MISSHVYFRGDVTYITSMARNVFGIGHVGDFYLKYEKPWAPHDLGEAVVAAFAAHREGTPGATYVRGAKRPRDPFLRFAGFGSCGSFRKP